MQYGWHNCPDDVRLELEQFVRGCRDILGEDLSGVYLHGSLAMGCFNPALSDLDLLVLSERELTQDDVNFFSHMLHALSHQPYPIEMSVLSREKLSAGAHPFPYEYHFSEAWRGKEPDSSPDKTDDDLAAHIVIARERGVTLYGEPARDALPQVPTDDYIDALLYDLDDTRRGIVKNPVYAVLNMCRVYWFLSRGAISSKDEAGEWAQSYLPEEHRSVVSKALRTYRGNGDVRFDRDSLEAFAAYVDEQVRALLS
jgi:predicted nucleotidyltransferase